MIDWHTQSVNEDVPPETMIMLMKSFLKNSEDKFFDEYKNKTLRFDE